MRFNHALDRHSTGNALFSQVVKESHAFLSTNPGRLPCGGMVSLCIAQRLFFTKPLSVADNRDRTGRLLATREHHGYTVGCHQ